MKKGMWVLLAVVALAVQTAGLGGLIALYEQVVTQGTEVRIPCEWVDPVDLLRGGYLDVMAGLELERGKIEDMPRDWGEERYVLLEPVAEGAVSHRAERLAKVPGSEGLWVKVPWYDWKWDEQDDCITWTYGAERRDLPLVVGFPGKLFMDERLAPGADKAFAARGEGASAVAVYRAWKGKMVIMDVEIDGVSVKELAKRGDDPPADP